MKQIVAITTDLFPMVILHELDGGRDGESRGRVLCPCPLEDVDKMGAGRNVWRGIRAPTHHERIHHGLNLTAHIEKPCPLRREHPLMTITKNDIGIQGSQVKR